MYGYVTTKETSLRFHLTLLGKRRDGFMHFSRALVQSEINKQSLGYDLNSGH